VSAEAPSQAMHTPPVEDAVAERTPDHWWQRISPVSMAYGAVVLLAIVGWINDSGFMSPSHLAVLLGIAAILGIVSAGQTAVILAAGIDLSVGAVLSAADVLTVQWTGGGEATVLVVIGIVLLGTLVGILNGSGVAFLGINPLVMTLGMTAVVSSAVLVITNGESGGEPVAWLGDAMTGKLFGLPGTFWSWAAVALVVSLVLGLSRFGRAIYAFGSNATAARLAGLRPKASIVAVYALSGTCAAIAGVVLAGYTGTGAYGIGESYTLMSIAAVVIGGASILGGRGSYIGTIAGVLILTMLDDILTVANVAASGRQVIQGVAILLILIIYGRERRMRTVS
jgi:ribose transport system permease protein